MDDAVRSVFVLYSFEEMTMAEIAALLEIPPGTVASRLRNARAIFKQEILSLQGRARQESA
jgi:RNA polymerase sigma-70 factor (ECF subfamily)